MIKPALIKYSLQNIYKRKTRSWLTIVSVLIGITAITALISFGYGISSYVSDFAQKMGSDKLMVMARGFGPGGMAGLGSNVKFDKSDVEIIERVNGIEEAFGMYAFSSEIEYNNQKRYTFVIGADYKKHRNLLQELLTVKIMEGSELSGDEKKKAVFGYNYRLPERVFSRALKLGDKIKINGKEIDVIGFYEEIGNPSDDAQIYITDVAAEEVFGEKNYYFIMLRASPGANTTETANIVAEKLRDNRNQKKGTEDFFVQTYEQVIATFTTILNVIIAVVVLIAVISVIVASVNIMNTMYASILERTKEIGIFKAIGAKNNEILTIFVMESGILSLIGGVIGVTLGFLIAKSAGYIIATAGYGFLKPFFSLQLISGILLFSFLVGIIAGFLPAYNASKLKPVEALRYE